MFFKNSLKIMVQVLIGVALSFSLAQAKSKKTDKKAPAKIKAAVAVMEAKSNSPLKGQVWFTPAGKMMKVKFEISGLSPGGKHGFHIHEKGDCSAPDAASAGGHFNPMSASHGSHDSAERHMGDLGNLQADSKGEAKGEVEISDLKLDGPMSILGKAVIVHLNPDDFKTQPTGNAGARIGCGVIKEN